MQPAFQFKSKGCNFQTKPNQVFKQQLQGMLFFPQSCFVVLMKPFNIFLKYKMYWKESQSKLQLTGLVIKYFSQCLIRIQGFRFLNLKFITHIEHAFAKIVLVTFDLCYQHVDSEIRNLLFISQMFLKISQLHNTRSVNL